MLIIYILCLCVLQGERGDKGDAGRVGDDGLRGEKGERGAAGIPGKPGEPGKMLAVYILFCHFFSSVFLMRMDHLCILIFLAACSILLQATSTTAALKE